MSKKPVIADGRLITTLHILQIFHLQRSIYPLLTYYLAKQNCSFVAVWMDEWMVTATGLLSSSLRVKLRSSSPELETYTTLAASASIQFY